jgi:sec-independent protein translocase protein TatB
MFEISWSELLILAVVTLIFVCPKDLPKFLNTMGRYAGMVRRQAAEFRAQFDEAMRQAELDALKKEVNEVRSGIEASISDAQTPKPAAQPPVEPAALQATLPLGRSAQEIAESSREPTGSGPGETVPAVSPPATPDDKAGA